MPPLRGLLPFVLLATLTGHAAADWKGDEAYIKRLQARVKQLKRVVALFERHQRALELVEAEIANVQLGLADPRGKPDELVRKLLEEAYPDVRITMTRRRTRAPSGVSVWSWRCRLEGAVGELRWATQLLRQKGLFIVPGPKEPVQLLPHRDQRRGALVFHGHHVRLKDVPIQRARHEKYDNALLARRTDPLAAEIRRLQAEVARLRSRVAVLGFEARLDSIKKYIDLLKNLTRRSRDPFRAITPLLDLELIRFDRIQHEGKRLLIRGATPSRSARRAARRWLRRRFRRSKLRLRIRALSRLYGPAPKAELLVPKELEGKGPACRLLAAGAGPAEVGLAATRRAVVVIHRQGQGPQRISGRVARIPCDKALGAAAAGLGYALLRHGRDVLLVPRDAADAARQALRPPRGPGGNRSLRGGRPTRLAIHGAPLNAVLPRLAGRLRGALEAPRGSKARVTLVGRAPTTTWLRLLAAGLGLSLSGRTGRTVRLHAKGRASQRVPAGHRRYRTGSPRLQTRLAEIRPSLFILGRGRRWTFVVLTAPDGAVSTARRGTLVGRNRSQVSRVDHRGVRLLWSGGGVTARLRLPPGEPRAARR